MLLELFIGLLFFSLALLFYGFYSRTDIFRLVGITLIFFLGVGLSPTMPDQIGGVQYQSGLIESVNGSDTTTTYLYSSYESHTLSFYLVAFALLTFFIIMVDRREYDQ